MNKIQLIFLNIFQILLNNFVSCFQTFIRDNSNEENLMFFSLSYNRTCLHRNHCSGPNEICTTEGVCECKNHYQYNGIFRQCFQCPDYGEFCFNDCCSQDNLQCVNSRCVCINDIGGLHLCNTSKTGIFMTASQIALSAALIMAIVALIMIIYRLYTRPRNLSNESDGLAISGNSNVNNTNVNRSTNFLRESLSSMQIRILSRLRDRPPTYDETSSSRQNSNANARRHQLQQQQQQRQLCHQVSAIHTILPTSIDIPEAPPPYESDREIQSTNTTTHLPPPYSEIIISPSNLLPDRISQNEQSNDGTKTSTTKDNDKQNEIITKEIHSI